MPETRFSYLNHSGEKISGVIHTGMQPPSKAVIVCHGFGSNKDMSPWLRDMCNHLSREGMAGVRIDFSGHGDSEGRCEDISYLKEAGDISSCIDYLEKNGYPSIGLIGHSMGASVCILTASQDPRPKVLAIIAGVAYPSQEDHIAFAKAFFEKAFQKKIPSESFILHLKQTDILSAVRKVHAPLLLIHGDADSMVPIAEGEAIFSAANEPKKMIIAIGSGHRLSQEPEFAAECIELCVEWMKKHLK